nr:6-phosphofructokinase [Maliibacterium massiliense]
MKRIGVLTSGGDAPGMNAAIRAIVRVAYANNIQVYGIHSGYNGLINGDVSVLDRRMVSGISLHGGTILRTARCDEFRTSEGQHKALANIREFGIEGIITIGGDGTFQGARALAEHGVPTVGVPGTIDNDLAYTDFTIGFDTAINTVVTSISKIRNTMESHGRIGVIEVMGRHCGDIALFSGVACGAEAVLIPELPYDMEEIAQSLMRRRELGIYTAIVVVAEGAASGEDVAKELVERTGLDIRATILGHVQRGGEPTATDAALAARLGGRAVELLADGKGKRVVGIVNNHIRDFDITEALNMKRPAHKKLYRLAYTLSF